MQRPQLRLPHLGQQGQGLAALEGAPLRLLALPRPVALRRHLGASQSGGAAWPRCNGGHSAPQ
eukprot:307023-Pyramimonas_sp.AAC.1